jgi:hypothetical protein
MKREEVLKRVNRKIFLLEKFLKEPEKPSNYLALVIMEFEKDLEFYKHIRSIIEGERKGGYNCL